MNPTLRKLLLTLSVSAIAATGPAFAQINAGTSVPAAQPLATPAPEPESDYRARGPVSIHGTTAGDELTYLHIVHRSRVVGGNIVRFFFSGIDGGARGKEDYLGDPVTDYQKRLNLVTPLLVEIPKAVDEKMTALLAESEGSGVAKRSNPLTITPLGWHLLYHELLAGEGREDEYVLRFAARFSKRPEGATDTFFRKAPNAVRECHYVSKPQTLAAWKANDYEAIATEQKLVTQSCVNNLASMLPVFLGLDANAKIKSAKLNCQTEMNLCVAEADTTADPKAAKVECKVEYKQCVSEDVKPLVDSTPIGACKATFATCKAAVIDKARAINPDVKPEKSDYLPCTTELKACVKTVKEAR